MTMYKGYLQDKNGDTLLPNVCWKNIIDKPNLYPIGAIYLSVDSTDPGKLFGGTWEQIEGKFLLGVSSNHEVLSEGGSETHILTKDELPIISGYFQTRMAITDDKNLILGSCTSPFSVEYVTWSGSHTGVACASSSSYKRNQVNFNMGGGLEHNNMPPYLTVYMWKRIA